MRGEVALPKPIAEFPWRVVIPLTLLVIFFLLYVHFGNVTEVLVVMLSLPFALVIAAVVLIPILYFLYAERTDR